MVAIMMAAMISVMTVAIESGPALLNKDRRYERQRWEYEQQRKRIELGST